MLPYVCEGEALAVGSYGKVYKGHKSGEPGTVVAIKVLRSHSVVGDAPLSKEAREREACTLQEAAHPHIVTYIAHFWVRHTAGVGEGAGSDAALSYAEATDADSLHLVTEFAAKALDSALRAGPAALASPAHLSAVRCYTAQLLSALRHLHDDCGIVHRDVKPSNVLLCEGGGEHGTVKLADLGSARALDLHGEPRSTVAAGTCDFMAPETLARYFRELEYLPCDDLPRPAAHADVWSIGALLAEAALGRAAFSAALKGAGGRAGLLPRLQAAPAWAALPEDVQRVLGRCLAGAPGERATAAKLLEDPQLAGPWRALLVAEPPAVLHVGAGTAAVFARVSASRAARHAIAAFCGGPLPHTILSACAGSLLPLLDTHSALPLRATCSEARAAVAQHQWRSRDGPIRGSVAHWRACFPRALCANLSCYMGYLYKESRAAPVVDADFAHLEGLRELDMSGCTRVSSAAFAHLGSLRRLDMSGCDQPALGDAALAHLPHLEALSVAECTQAALTGRAFAPLQRLRALDMSATLLGDDALGHLAPTLQVLDVSGCSRLTDAAVPLLARVRVLRLSGAHMSEAFLRAARVAQLGSGSRGELCGARGEGGGEALW